MNLDRGTLATIDRRLLSAMDHQTRVQLVKVPVSEAVWSTWRRYCDTAGVTMGRGIAVLIHHELTSVIDEDFEHLREVLASREAQLAVREAKLDEREEDLGAWKRRLADLERVVMAQASELTAPPN
jgi:hypothetical protein